MPELSKMEDISYIFHQLIKKIQDYNGAQCYYTKIR